MLHKYRKEMAAKPDKEWVIASHKVWIPCLGCGRPITGTHLLCKYCKEYTPKTYLRENVGYEG
jgi:hypothetical protein